MSKRNKKLRAAVPDAHAAESHRRRISAISRVRRTSLFLFIACLALMVAMILIPNAAARWNAVPSAIQWLYVFAWFAIGLFSHRTFQEALETNSSAPDAAAALLRITRIRMRTNSAAFALCALGYIYLSGAAQAVTAFIESAVFGAGGAPALPNWATFAVACAVSGVIGNFVYDVLKRTVVAGIAKAIKDDTESAK